MVTNKNNHCIKMYVNKWTKKLRNLKRKGPGFYLILKINKIKSRSTLFGAIFKHFYPNYEVENVRINTGKNLFPVSMQSRFFFKTYEQEEIALAKKYIHGSETILELGACIGVISCVTNKRLNKPDQHVVVEANPDLIPCLTQNRDVNNCSFRILNAVVSDKEKVAFYTYGSALAGSIVEKKNINGDNNTFKKLQIDSCTPNQIERDTGVKFDTLIMDIEGGEIELIEKFKDWISSLHLLMIEFHPNIIGDGEKINRCRRTLEEYCGFEIADSIGQSFLLIKSDRADGQNKIS
jgi:FkbM family methyltransferase